MSERQSRQAIKEEDNPPQASDVLEVEGLSVVVTKATGDLPIVTDVSFSLPRGSAVAVVGESGCGKSTLALALLGLTDPQAIRASTKRLSIAGQEMSSASERAWREVRGASIGMVFQEPMSSLDPAFRVGDQVAEVVRRHEKCTKEKARARTLEVLDLVQIKDAERRARQYPHELSGGLLQRASIGLALASDPDVLVLDEPTTALDVSTQASLLRLLDDLRERLEMAILLITHDLGVVAEVAEDVLVMYAGEIVEAGSVREVFEHPSHPYTAGLLESLPTVHLDERRLAYIAGAPPAPGDGISGCRFHPRCEYAASGTCDTKPIELRPASGAEEGAVGRQSHRHRCARAEHISLAGV